MYHYQYSPLQPDGSEIRLIRLPPGPSEASIEIEIFHAEQATAPPYEALSSVWGSTERNDYIIVRQQGIVPITLGITYNLAVALRHLRHPIEHKVLWVDAICINQDDLPERAAQVMEICSIYKNARQVIVWLGPRSHNSFLALDTLRTVADDIEFNPKTHRLTFRGWTRTMSKDIYAMKAQANRWIAIKDLFSREWFSRLWVFQEINMATSACIAVGNDCMDWKTFLFGLKWIRYMCERSNGIGEYLVMKDFRGSSLHGYMTMADERGTPSDIMSLLHMTMKLSCRDPRDRLFAIRSLAWPYERGLIKPDYTKSVEEIYTTFVRRCALDGDTRFLDRCELQDPQSTLSLPSWVPDYSSTDFPYPMPGYSIASGVSRTFIVGEPAGDKITLQGVNIATLTHTSPFVKASDTDSELIQRCRYWKALIPSFAEYGSGGMSTNAFYETLVCGRVKELMPVNFGTLTSFESINATLEDYDEDGILDTQFVIEARRLLPGRAFFKTAEGVFGVGPELANHGDHVVVILGHSMPLILRPVELQGKTCFRVVGQCYVPGLMCAEALLGPLPHSWSMKYEYVDDTVTPLFIKGSLRTQQDPRMPLPEYYRYVYRRTYLKDAEEIEGMSGQQFEDRRTGKKTDFDPRLTPELLRERGVDIKDFTLV